MTPHQTKLAKQRNILGKGRDDCRMFAFWCLSKIKSSNTIQSFNIFSVTLVQIL